MRFLKGIILSLLALVSPLSVQAQTSQAFRDVAADITDLLRSAIPVLIGAAFLVFFIGLAEYIFQAGDQSAVEKGRKRMIAGVIGLFVIAAIWGLVALVGNTFGIQINPN